MKKVLFVGMLMVSGYNFAQEAEPEINEPTWDVRCFPNPTSDLLMIVSSVEIKEVTLFDLNGQLIKAPALPNFCFSLHDIPAGWIFVFIENADGQVVKKNIYKQ